LNRYILTIAFIIMTLNTKILVGFVACTVVLGIVASISFTNSEKFIETNRWVNHTHEVLEELDLVLVGSVNTETGARGFLITGEQSYLEPYNSGKLETGVHLRKVRELTADNPTQQANIGKIEAVVDARMEVLAGIIGKRQKNEMTLAETRDAIVSSRGKELQDEIRRLVEEAQSIERNLLSARIVASEKEAADFKTLFIGLLGVIAVVLVAMYVIIRLNLRALKQAQDESNRKNWTLTGSGDLVRAMQGNRLPPDLAQQIISHLVGYVNGLLGAIYITGPDNRSLQLMASTAVTKEEQSTMIPFGEGLVGRAAVEKKAVIVKDISDTDFKLSSSFGNVPPRNVIALPFLFEKSVIGVVELGTLQPFTEDEVEYLNFVSDSIAIAVVSCLAREKTNQLLEETQRQAEELEVQQEELRQSNDELLAKTELLQQSEMALKTQQEELRVANEELGQKADILENQKALLEKAKSETEVKARQVEVTSKYKSEFLANMSHELRTPLNSILILAQLLSENKSGKLAQKDIEYAKNIHTSGSDLLNLINDILDLSKVEAGKRQLEIDEVPLKRIVGSMSAMFTELANSKGIKFKINVDSGIEDQVLKTDRHRVEQIIRNLLSNAFKFTSPSGDVILTISRTGDKPMLSFAVKDTGIGIPEDKQKLVFEAFQQADGSTKRKFGGTGLGLSISRELAHALGGEITLASQEGKGSTFTLYLPLLFDPSQSSSGNKEIEMRDVTIPKPPSIATAVESNDHQVNLAEASDDRYKIKENDRVVLIIEDDEQFASVLLDLVRERHYKGIVAREGIAGITIARHYKPDAIVLDLMLPIMSGADVLKHLKNDPDLRHIPVQIISAMDQRKDVLDAGAFDFIQKPVSSVDLRKAFEKIENFSTKKVKRLLIVEDNEMQNLAIKELIGNGDVKCTSAFLGQEALQMLEKEKFDCMILDLGLPDISGFDLLEKIKASSSIQPLPIVVYTGKELKKEDAMRLNRLASTVVLKTANSHERLLDETILFLHRVESRLPKEKQTLIRKLHKVDELLKGKKILIVDDDIRNIYSLTNALEDEEIVPIVADNGRSAVEALQNDPAIDLVLMDIMMPEMDGYEATIEIRKDARFQRLPIIALTAKAMKGDKERCLAVGMSDYVSKPVDIAKLLSLMRVWLYK
jgi:signal transduction histidine kinase/DNA-binding response OmpR family regulator/CHASE3 domain sensor protein